MKQKRKRNPLDEPLTQLSVRDRVHLIAAEMVLNLGGHERVPPEVGMLAAGCVIAVMLSRAPHDKAERMLTDQLIPFIRDEIDMLRKHAGEATP